MVANTLIIADELLAMPDDGHRYELVEGELVRMAPADFDSSNIGGLFVTSLNIHVVPRRLGIVAPADAGVRQSSNPDTVLSPDATFIRRDHLPVWSERRGYWRVPPDLVVEVVSPSDRRRNALMNDDRYLDLGVAMVVVVWPPTRTMTVHRPNRAVETLGEHDVFDGDDVVAGFRMPVADLFLEI